MPPRQETESTISHLLCQVLTLWVLISVLLWRCLKPMSPVYRITNVYITTLTQQNSTFANNTKAIGNNSVSLYFEISNPNKRIGIYYNDINITFYYNDAIIGTNSLTGFYQRYNEATSYGVVMNTNFQKSRRKVTSNSLERIQVCLETAVRYEIFSWKTKLHRMDYEAYIGIGSDGRFSGERDVKLQKIVK